LNGPPKVALCLGIAEGSQKAFGRNTRKPCKWSYLAFRFELPGDNRRTVGNPEVGNEIVAQFRVHRDAPAI
jgi:hypothetical protein